MRLLPSLVLLALPLMAADTDEQMIIKTVNTTFDAIAEHSAEKGEAAFTPDARLLSVRGDQPPRVMTRDEFVKGISASKAKMLERMWNPTVLVRGRIAMLWAEYDFHLDGKFHHCGVDTFLLVKNGDAWKIFSLEYTAETEGCKPSPLGPPRE